MSVPVRGRSISSFQTERQLKVNRRRETVCPPSAAFWGAAVLMNAWSGLLVLIADWWEIERERVYGERERSIRAGPVVTALSRVDNRPISLRYLENLCMCRSTRALNGHSHVGKKRLAHVATYGRANIKTVNHFDSTLLWWFNDSNFTEQTDALFLWMKHTSDNEDRIVFVLFCYFQYFYLSRFNKDCKSQHLIYRQSSVTMRICYPSGLMKGKFGCKRKRWQVIVCLAL